MDALRAVAEARGYFSRADALRAGYDDNAIARACRVEAWRRVRPGAYTFSDLWPSARPDQARLVGHVVADRLAPNVALSHVTAALDHGLTVWSEDDAVLDLTHVTRLDGTAGRCDAGVLHHEGFTLPSDVVRLDGRSVMNAARAALETASMQSQEAGLVTLDNLLHQKKATRSQLLSTYEDLQHWPAMRHVRVPVLMASGKAESVGESRSRWLFHTQSVPAPQLQHPVVDDVGRLLGYTDFAWPGLRLLGEFDGKVKYQRLLRDGETPSEAVVREKRREERLCEQTGWLMIRLVWSDLYHPAATAARVRRLMTRAAAA